MTCGENNVSRGVTERTLTHGHTRHRHARKQLQGTGAASVQRLPFAHNLHGRNPPLYIYVDDPTHAFCKQDCLSLGAPFLAVRFIFYRRFR